MNKQPYEMTKAEFNRSFPYFKELSSKQKHQLYKLARQANLDETGEDISYSDFTEFMKDLRCDVEDGGVLLEEHQYYIKQAFRYDGLQSIPDTVLDEYPELVDEYITKQLVSQEQKLKKRAKLQRQKEEAKFYKDFFK